jgi:hypothetical protein
MLHLAADPRHVLYIHDVHGKSRAAAVAAVTMAVRGACSVRAAYGEMRAKRDVSVSEVCCREGGSAAAATTATAIATATAQRLRSHRHHRSHRHRHSDRHATAVRLRPPCVCQAVLDACEPVAESIRERHAANKRLLAHRGLLSLKQ